MKQRLAPVILLLVLSLSLARLAFSQGSYQEPGNPSRPTYEAFRVDRLVSEADVNPSGDITLSIPLLSVPNRLGHDWQLTLTFNGNISQRQRASWVGLGWDLDIGYVERTINGRSDDQIQGLPNGELGEPGYQARSEKYGRLWSNHNRLASMASADSFDQLDVYRLNIAGEGTEVLPFPSYPDPLNPDDTIKVDPTNFLSPRYKPWKIAVPGWPSGSQQIERFYVQKEDGTQCFFGAYDPYSVDHIEVKTLAGQSPVQDFIYPYRWNLTKVVYPDGVTATVDYAVQNRRDYIHTWDQVQIDRFRDLTPWSNTFGKLDDSFSDGEVLYEYSRPCTLKTETHYAVFYCSLPSDESTERHCRLDSIRLFDRQSNQRLTLIEFSYSTVNNAQQTLESIQVAGSDGHSLPPYQFSYVYADLVSPMFLTLQSRLQDHFPGYYSDFDSETLADEYAKAWKISSLTLPTGGTISYTYERIARIEYTPETQMAGATHWGFACQPHARVKTKTVTNDLGESRTWTYDYSAALFDWPSRVTSSTYVPTMYQSALLNGLTSFNYYKAFRGCPVVHRWVRVTAPDGSTRRVHFTTSYSGPDADSRESHPDSLLVEGWRPNEKRLVSIRSNAGARGLIWKEVFNDRDSSITDYIFPGKGLVHDRYEYYWYYGPGKLNHYIVHTSMLALQSAVTSVRDGVTSQIQYTYDDQGFLIRKKQFAGNVAITASYEYAQHIYPDMFARHMWSQPYKSEMVRSPGGTDKSRWTTWKHLTANDTYVPEAEWVTTTGNDNIKVLEYTSYDAYGNVTQTTDANGFATSYTYGGYNSPAGVNTWDNAYLRSVSRQLGGTTFTKSFAYTPLGGVSTITDENGASTSFAYDGFKRLTSVRGPENTVTNDYTYTDNIDGEGMSLTRRDYRTPAEATETALYADNLGQQYQTRVSLGSKAMFSHTVYDPLWRVLRQYKPYLADASVLRDGQAHVHDSTYYAQLGVLTGSRPFISFVYDPSGRVIEQHAPGAAFDTDSTIQRTRYGANTPGDFAGGASATRFKTSRRDEDGRTVEEYRDVLGNLVLSRVDSAGLRLTTSFEYNGAGQLLKSTRPGGGHSEYAYDLRGKLIQKKTPETGTTDYLYDKNGNLRMVRDGAHQATAVNSVSLGADIIYPATATGQFTLSQPGRMQLQVQVYDPGDPPGFVTLTIKANSTPVASISTTEFHGNSGTFVLPKGIYTYQVTTTQDGGYHWSIICSTGLEFLYTKYDLLNRPVEMGEYESSSLLDFTKQNAETVSFPGTGNIVEKAMTYDQSSADPYAAGQRNLLGRLSSASSYDHGTLLSQDFYSYDVYGRLEWVVQKSLASGTPQPRKIAYQYDLQGNITRKQYIDLLNGANNHSWWYEYDLAGSLARVYSGSDSLSRVKEAAYAYRAGSMIDTLQLGVIAPVTYKYNERDWLTSLESPQFSEHLGYNLLSEVASVNASRPQFGGNISWMTSATLGSTNSGSDVLARWIGYSFGYDKANRLTSAAFGVYDNSWHALSNASVPALTYDADGNIDSLSRYSISGAPMDRLRYHYTSFSTEGIDTLGAIGTDYMDSGWESTISPLYLALSMGPLSQENVYIPYSRSYSREQECVLRVKLGVPTGSVHDMLNLQVSAKADYNPYAGGGGGGAVPQPSGGTEGVIAPDLPWNPNSTYAHLVFKLYEKSGSGELQERSMKDTLLWTDMGVYSLTLSLPIASIQNPAELYAEFRVSNWSDSLSQVTLTSLQMSVPITRVALVDTLTYISDVAESTVSTVDIDNQPTNNYAYDGNGNVTKDLEKGIGFITYNTQNLPLAVYKTNGQAVRFAYDQAGRRIYKSDPSGATSYVLGGDGKTEAIETTSGITYPIWGGDLLGQVKRAGGTLSRFYYLKDHLGSVRVTVKSGDTLITDTFNATLAQWTTVKGSGFYTNSSLLMCSAASGTENILVNSSALTTDDGLLMSMAKLAGPSYTGGPALVFRYTDINNFSFVEPTPTSLMVKERISGVDSLRGSVPLSMANYVLYRFTVRYSGKTVSVMRDGAVVLTSSTLTRLSTGKVGVRVLMNGSGNCGWEDLTVIKTGADQIASYDDFYPYGQVIEGRSYNAGQSDTRFKFLAKEHDTETGLEWLEARSYDARIGRFLTIDPLAQTNRFRSWSPYHYSYDNPLRFADPTGMGPERQWWQVKSDEWFGSSPFNREQEASSEDGTSGLGKGNLLGHASSSQVEGTSIKPYAPKRQGGSVGRVLLKTMKAKIFSAISPIPIDFGVGSFAFTEITPNVAVYLEDDGSQSVDIDVFARSNASDLFKVSYAGRASLIMNNGIVASQGLERIPQCSLFDKVNWSPVGHASFALPQDRARLEVDIIVYPRFYEDPNGFEMRPVTATIKIR